MLSSKVHIKGVPGLTQFTARHTGSASLSPWYHVLRGKLIANWTAFKGRMVKGLETISYKEQLAECVHFAKENDKLC